MVALLVIFFFFFLVEVIFVHELQKFNSKIYQFLYTQFTQREDLWQKTLLFVACLQSLFYVCQFMKVYSRDLKHKYGKVLPQLTKY